MAQKIKTRESFDYWGHINFNMGWKRIVFSEIWNTINLNLSQNSSTSLLYSPHNIILPFYSVKYSPPTLSASHRPCATWWCRLCNQLVRGKHILLHSVACHGSCHPRSGSNRRSGISFRPSDRIFSFCNF